MKLLRDERAQTGTIMFIIIGIFMMGIIYVMLGYVMNENEVVTNDLIVNQTDLAYSQERADMMNDIYLRWWSVPIYTIILFAIYGIKKAIDKRSQEAY